jgi:replicative DNA helicase
MGTKLTDEAVHNLLAKASTTGKGNKQDKLSELEVSFEDVDSFGNQESLKEMYVNIKKYNDMLAQKITFINGALSAAIPFTRENLYLITAYTGSGKSTIAANISYPLWKQGKKTLVISNEESKQDVLFRIGCLELGYNFNDYKKGKMPLQQQTEVAKLFPMISDYVKVLDVTYKGGLTTKIEGVKNALMAVKSSDYSCAMIDYYQLIKYSVEQPDRDGYNVLNDLRIWLGQYIKDTNIPIVLFAQLHSASKRQVKDIDGRIKDCSAIIEPATVIIEAIPNYDDLQTEFVIHKDRFGYAGQRIVCGFDKGRYVNMTNEFMDQVMHKKLSNIQNALDSKDKPDDPIK